MPNAAQEELFTSTEGFFVTKALLALWRLGVLEEAEHTDELSVEEYAAKHGCDAELLRALLDYLVIRGYFDAEQGVFRLSERGRRVSPYFGYLPMHVGAYEPVFGSLEAVVRGELVYGKDVRRSETEMLSGMTALEEHVLSRLSELTGDGDFHRVLDLGCGSANLLCKLLLRDPRLRGVGVDWEQAACVDALHTLAQAGLSDRAAVVRGDAGRIRELPADLLDGVDLVVAMFVMHELYRQRARDGVVACLRDVASTIGESGRLLMVEVSRIDAVGERPGLRFVPEYQLIHEFSNQRLASQEVWREMLAEAGLTVLRTEPAGMCEAFCFVAAKAKGVS